MKANEEVLIERFRKRLVDVRASGGKVSVDNEVLYKSNLAKEHFLPEHVFTLDTTKAKESETIKEALNHIKK